MQIAGGPSYNSYGCSCSPFLPVSLPKASGIQDKYPFFVTFFDVQSLATESYGLLTLNTTTIGNPLVHSHQDTLYELVYCFQHSSLVTTNCNHTALENAFSSYFFYIVT